MGEVVVTDASDRQRLQDLDFGESGIAPVTHPAMHAG
jgi:hypothetical protein